MHQADQPRPAPFGQDRPSSMAPPKPAATHLTDRSAATQAVVAPFNSSGKPKPTSPLYSDDRSGSRPARSTPTDSDAAGGRSKNLAQIRTSV
ncbi:hypothetical protein ACLOJK_034236 [Asimina triloba]